MKKSAPVSSGRSFGFCLCCGWRRWSLGVTGSKRNFPIGSHGCRSSVRSEFARFASEVLRFAIPAGAAFVEGIFLILYTGTPPENVFSTISVPFVVRSVRFVSWASAAVAAVARAARSVVISFITALFFCESEKVCHIHGAFGLLKGNNFFRHSSSFFGFVGTKSKRDPVTGLVRFGLGFFGGYSLTAEDGSYLICDR